MLKPCAKEADWQVRVMGSKVLWSAIGWYYRLQVGRPWCGMALQSVGRCYGVQVGGQAGTAEYQIPMLPRALQVKGVGRICRLSFDFSCTKLAGKVAIGHDMTVGCCNCYNCKPIDRHLNCAGDMMRVAILRTGHRSLSFSAIVILNGC